MEYLYGVIVVINYYSNYSITTFFLCMPPKNQVCMHVILGVLNISAELRLHSCKSFM